jgi:hypothetical protein
VIAEARRIATEGVATIQRMTKAELHRQIDSMTEDEAAEVKLIYAPDWPSKATSIEEVRRRTGTRAMTSEESQGFWQKYGPLMQPPDGEG